MKIAVIGTGNVGSALGGSFARAGHDVTFAARDAAKAARIAEAAGGRSRQDPATAAADADVVVLAVPFTAIPAIADELAPFVAGKVVIDPTNPLTPDYSGLSTSRRPVRAPSASPRSCPAPTSSRRSTRCSRRSRPTPGPTGPPSTP